MKIVVFVSIPPNPDHKHHQQLSTHKFFLISKRFLRAKSLARHGQSEINISFLFRLPNLPSPRRNYDVFLLFYATLVQNKNKLLKSLIKINLCSRRKKRNVEEKLAEENCEIVKTQSKRFLYFSVFPRPHVV